MTHIEHKGLGRIVDQPDERDHPIRRYLAPRPTPTRFSRMAQLGPVLDQGLTPTCVAHGAATVKTQQERRDHRRTYQFNPHYLYMLCKTRDGIPHLDGTFTRTALDILHEIGYGRLSKPWETDAGRYKIKAYARLRTIAEMEETIRYIGPVLIGLDWDASWSWRSTLLGTPSHIRPAGGHLMVIAAFDRAAQRFTIRNSWGADAHTGGNVDITYHEIERQLALPDWQSADVWSVVDIAL